MRRDNCLCDVGSGLGLRSCSSILLAVHRYLSGLLLILEHVYIHKIDCIFYSTWQVARRQHIFFAYYFIGTKKQARQVSAWGMTYLLGCLLFVLEDQN